MRYQNHPPLPPHLRPKPKPIAIPPAQLENPTLSFLSRFVSKTGTILSRRDTGLRAKDQRKVAKFIKRYRDMGLVPFNGEWSVKKRGM